MTSANLLQTIWPISLVVLSQTRVAGDNLLLKIDKSLFASYRTSNVSAALSEIDANAQGNILVIDHPLADGRILKLVKDLRKKISHSKLSILCITKKLDLVLLPELIEKGGVDFQTSPITEETLNARLIVCTKMLRREYKLSQALIQDPLTGLPNRQRFLDQAEAVYASAKRDQVSVVVAMISPDHLNLINSKYGQTVGDHIIQGISELLAHRKRDTDLLCRFDGSRFCLLTVNLNETHLITFLDDVLASFQAHEFENGAHTVNVTASIGATSYLGRNIEDMFEQAERALFKAREEGHNRFEILNESTSEPVPAWSILN